MSDEMKEVERTILDIDALEASMAVGHVSALALVTQMREGSGGDNELYYRQYEPLPDTRDPQDDLRMMAEYVCDRPDNVSGEQLFRKAAELALHEAPSGSYFDQPYEIQMGYRLFARACRLVFIDLEIEQREERSRLEQKEAQKPRIPIDDQAIETEDGMFDKDEEIASVLKAMNELPATKADLSDKAAIASETKEDPDPRGDHDAPMSIGERPVAHHGKPGRGGARTIAKTQQ